MKHFSLILLTFFFISCQETPKKESADDDSFSIVGTLNGDYSDYIYLNYGGIKDSVKVLNNRFEFYGKVEQPTPGSLNLEGYHTVADLYIENSAIRIETDYKQIINNGEPLNVLLIKDLKGSYSAKIQNEYKAFYQANQNKDHFKTLLYDKLKLFIKENKRHPFSGTVLAENAYISPVLTKNELLELYALLDTNQQNKLELDLFKMGIANLDKYGVNKPFLEFTLPNTKDNNTDITSFLGKITLVDFWASWCRPCRIKHPELINLKKKFEAENFDIVSVSIDSNKKNWLQAIEKDHLNWTNLIDTDKQVTNELGIQGIPFNYLIDEEGFVLGVNLPIEHIEKIVNEKINN
ncbi:redoxin family protein [Bizionia paragorgiae]|uniref:redoxin family protein n=1 Tax=Bizionia paragorgiae TaxID=283786 RepID=UPI003A959671